MARCHRGRAWAYWVQAHAATTAPVVIRHRHRSDATDAGLRRTADAVRNTSSAAPAASYHDAWKTTKRSSSPTDAISDIHRHSSMTPSARRSARSSAARSARAFAASSAWAARAGPNERRTKSASSINDWTRRARAPSAGPICSRISRVDSHWSSLTW
ncbi:hypothetical protein [Streptomyces sp. CRN 30]|uniref:hypothetical protein n=1 Tax=Streptomyces sp. CRN 30 TaxID=3075613 RepID=UPI002A82219C|nr:hypothetical protein [Streptomyces sp. CRN 30]